MYIYLTFDLCGVHFYYVDINCKRLMFRFHIWPSENSRCTLYTFTVEAIYTRTVLLYISVPVTFFTSASDVIVVIHKVEPLTTGAF